MGTETEERVAAFRAFNRFYTGVLGLLRSGYLHTRYTLTEVRVLYELGRRDATDLRDLRAELDLDAGYATRILDRLESDDLVTRVRSDADGRRKLIELTAAGRALVRTVDERSSAQAGELLDKLPDDDQRRLLSAMEVIRELLSGAPEPASFLLRPLRPGDLGRVVSRNGAVYAAERGWDSGYEALVARIVAEYVERHDPDRDNAWAAERDGEPVGWVFCVHTDDPATAQLRLLLVEPSARGLGVGGRLVDECVRFARAAGYRTLTLWTVDELDAARRLYQRAGFELVESEPERPIFGRSLSGQTWSLAL